MEIACVMRCKLLRDALVLPSAHDHKPPPRQVSKALLEGALLGAERRGGDGLTWWRSATLGR
jgi:hypothetical protein